MKGAAAAIALMLAGFGATVMAQTRPSDSVGEWRVIESACSGCKGGPDNEGDARIVIAPNRVLNPFAASCEGPVEFDVVRREKLGDVFRELGLPKRWKPKRLDAMSRIDHLVIGCDKGVNGRFYQLTRDEMLMPYEADTTFLLRRILRD